MTIASGLISTHKMAAYTGIL